MEDARHLVHRYDKLHQDVEGQVAEVLRHRSKSRGPSVSEENLIKLQSAEGRLDELKFSIMALGREAASAMLSVEEQQQKMTFHALFTMVDAERSYHQHALAILERLHTEMTLEKQPQEFSSPPSVKIQDISSPLSVKIQEDVDEWLGRQDNKSNGFDDHGHLNQDDTTFIAKVIHQFDAQADAELSLSIDDYVVVRQVAPNGWSEGECKGKAGWFPSAYIQRQEKAPASKIL